MSSVSALGEVPRITCLLPPAPEESGFFTPTAKLQIWLWVGLALLIIAPLGGLMSLLYQQAGQRAKSDMHNLSLTLEARLNATLHDAQTALLEHFPQMRCTVHVSQRIFAHAPLVAQHRY
jgi:hypothetical protein